MLETLKAHDMVQLNKSTKKYRLGFRILYLGEEIKKNLNIIDIARPIIREVSEDLGHSIHLCTYNNKLVYVIDQIVREQTFTVSATVGMLEPLHASSVGKCILAYRREEILHQLLDSCSFERYTKNTITNKKQLLLELESVRKKGYAIDNEEITEGVRCVAVPIFNFGNNVKYSIGMSSSVSLMTEDKIEHYIKRLTYAATKIGRELGYISL